jgi:hypothetical protein
LLPAGAVAGWESRLTDAVEKVRVSRLTTPLGRFGPSEIGLVFWL